MLLLDRTTSRFSPVSRSIRSILSVRASHQYSFPSCGDERTSQLVWGQHYPLHLWQDVLGFRPPWTTLLRLWSPKEGNHVPTSRTGPQGLYLGTGTTLPDANCTS